MNGLKDALELVQTTAVAARRVTFERPGGMAADQVFQVTPGPEGPKVALVTLPPSPREYQAYTVAGLVEQAIYLRRGEDTVTVFVGRDAVHAVVNERGERRDVVTLNLERSKAFTALLDDTLSNVGQRELIMAMRLLFPSRVTPESLLPMVRTVKFTQSSDGTSQLQHGRESLGKSVHAAVAGAEGGWPEEAVLRCPVYQNVPGNLLEEASVRCVFDVEVQNARFTLKALPGECEQALAQANEWLAGEIRAKAGKQIEVLAESCFAEVANPGRAAKGARA